MRTSLFLGLTGLALLAACGLSWGAVMTVSKTKTHNFPPPTVDVSVDEVNRTTASFTINTNNASDYVYAVLPATETIADAEALFERGPVRYFEGEKTVKVDLNDLVGDTEYNLYVAVRNIHP